MIKPKRRTHATRFIWQAYDRMRAGGVDDIFMQGDEADSFIDECRKMWKRYRSLPISVCEMALAEPYTDLWS